MPSAPLFQGIIFHRQLTNLALQFGDLRLILGNAHFIEFVCQLACFVLMDPLADETARDAVLARDFT